MQCTLALFFSKVTTWSGDLFCFWSPEKSSLKFLIAHMMNFQRALMNFWALKNVAECLHGDICSLNGDLLSFLVSSKSYSLNQVKSVFSLDMAVLITYSKSLSSINDHTVFVEHNFFNSRAIWIFGCADQQLYQSCCIPAASIICSLPP